MFWKKLKRSDPLDAPVLHWNPRNPFTLRDLLASVIIFGRSGSGKTSSSGFQLLLAIVAMMGRRTGGLILGAKPEDKGMVQAIFKAAGRELLIFEADGKLRMNFLDYELSKGAHTRNICRCIMTIGESLRASDSKGGEDGDFWEQQKERFLYNAIVIVRLATGTITAPDLQRFFTEAAYSVADLSDEKWRARFHNKCLSEAFQKQKSTIEEHDYALAADFWMGEFPKMAEKTRSSVLANVMGTLHVFNTGIVREMVSGVTNVSPDVTLEGQWVFLNFPPSEWGDIGNFVNAGWKYLVQRAVLRRHAGPDDCINVIWADESNQFINSFDPEYLSQCRSHLGCMVYLTQGVHSYFSVLKGQSGRHQAESLWTNFHHKIFHALGDIKTAELASGLLGKSLQQTYGGSTAPVEDSFDELFGSSQFTGNFSERWEPILHPNAFINGLRTGGKLNGYLADAIVIKSGEPFSNGQNFLRVAFSQR